MRASKGVEEVVVAGSLGRRKETIGDVDLLARFEGVGTEVVERFLAYSGVARVL